VTKVGGTDVLNPILEIPNLATNDAGQLSLTEYAVLAIAPELAPNSVKEWDQSTIAGSEQDKNEKTNASVDGDAQGKKKRFWRRLLCS